MAGREPRRAVFLDRDGVLSSSEVRDGRPYAPLSLEAFRILPDAAASVARLRAAGFIAIVVSNQPDVATGALDPKVLDAMHSRLRATVPVDDVRVCTCLDGCANRKPLPGMLIEAAEEWSVDLGSSWMVGDRWRDVGAGRAAGCATILIDRGYAEAVLDPADHVVASLGAAVDLILEVCASVGAA